MFVHLVNDNCDSKTINLNNVKEISYDKDCFKLEWTTGGFRIFKNQVVGKGLANNGGDLMFDNLSNLKQKIN